MSLKDHIHQDITIDPQGDYVFMKVCPPCGGTTNIRVTANKFHRWHTEKVLIQKVWPEASTDDRETMISGFHASCWDDVFKDGEDDE